MSGVAQMLLGTGTNANMLFTPLQLFSNSEQGVWYDPSDFSTMFQDAAGTTPVTAIEQPVGLILDKSGNNNHASQSTTTSRPILRQEAGGQYYLAFDGSDDWLQTANINFSATNKMSVFAGVRKLTTDLYGFIAELSASASANNGTFFLQNNAIFAGDYAYASKGTTIVSAASTTFTIPVTNVLTGLSDISGDLVNLRVNGTSVSSSSNDQGTGNYGTYPIYIGRRGGTSFPFNGRIYSFIARGALTASPQLEQTESWVNSKTGAY